MNTLKYHFIGIGGVSMSALACILKNQGNYVSGSDIHESYLTQNLALKGIKIFMSHCAENVNGVDVVVYNSAIAQDNVELVRAKELGLKILSRAQLLKKVSEKYENVIAISGAHGKTTTTAMITETFILAKLNPTAHLGGVLKSQNSNLILGGNKFFITEACEYKDNFLSLLPSVGIILNVEPEHLDYFKTFENVCHSFEKFASNSNVVVASDKLDISIKNPILFGDCGYRAKNIVPLKMGRYKFDCYYENKKLFNVKMNVIGKYNINNALACIAVCKYFNISNKIIKKALEKFKGVKRRFECKCKKPLVVHDYAHHPSEIKSVISATKKFVKGKLVVAFQPHTYSRTKALMQEFLDAFDFCDELLIIKTYSAREDPIKGGTAKDLYNNMIKKKKNVEYFSSFDCCFNYLVENLKKNDTLLILGAGDVEQLADRFELKQ